MKLKKSFLRYAYKSFFVIKIAQINTFFVQSFSEKRLSPLKLKNSFFHPTFYTYFFIRL